MGRSPCCVKEGLNKGAWTAIEDKILMEYVIAHGEWKWRSLPKKAGLKRCGKSCRLRWLNYLRPDIKRGNITPDEEELIIRLHKLLGNRWSLIAGRLPGRTDNEIKNYWNTNLSKRVNQQQSHPLSDLATTHPKKSRPDPTNKKARTMNKPKSTPQPITSNVVRTKAVRCTKLFIEPQLLQPNSCNHANQNNAMNNNSMVQIVQPSSTDNFNLDSKVDNNNSSSTKLNDQENIITPSDLVMKEFTHIGEFDLISELLNSDFSSEFYLNNESNTNCAYSLSPSSSEMPPSFSELLENWLGDEQAIDVGSALCKDTSSIMY